MTFLDSLTKNLSITDTEGMNRAILLLMQHMQGKKVLPYECRFCGRQYDGQDEYCLLCSELHFESKHEATDLANDSE